MDIFTPKLACKYFSMFCETFGLLMGNYIALSLHYLGLNNRSFSTFISIS